MGDQPDMPASKANPSSTSVDQISEDVEIPGRNENPRPVPDNDTAAAKLDQAAPRPIPPTQIPGPTTPSAAAVQRAMSISKSVGSHADTSLLDAIKDRTQRTGRNSPVWPTSPRLKSPPPSILKGPMTRRNEATDQAHSNISIKRLAPVSNPEWGAAMQVVPDAPKDQPNATSSRSSGRGASAQSAGLETVAESSLPTTPAIGPVPNPTEDVSMETSTLEEPLSASTFTSSSKSDAASVIDLPPKLTIDLQEGGSASAPASRAASTSRPQTGSTLAKRSFTSLTGRKAAIEPLRSMTVETETVNSTPQILGDRGRDGGGTIGPKPSIETIRPKKEKRKASRKTASLQAGTGTSKADIFEAKVASAVDEADSSDSDETFVYESNPPDPRPARHHSRTPSATSMTSQMDHFNRLKHGVRGGSAAIHGKKSMKFSSGTYGTHLDAEGSGGDAGRNSLRTNNATPRHHHVGRHGRNSHASIIDVDSPFTQGNRFQSPKSPMGNGHRHSQPSSPRASSGRLASNRKSITGGYDTYDDGADDERAPLMGSVRINRTRHSRRPNSHFRTMEFAEYPEPRCWPRFGGCLLLAILIVFVAAGITTFVLALNRPLLDVEVKHIQNVLASEEELMVDLHVRAINPNLYAIAVNELEVDVFAVSPYAGTEQEWLDDQERHRPVGLRRLGRRRASPVSRRGLPSWFPPFDPSDGVDEGTDPIDDPEPGNKKLLLGRIYTLDSPLVFDASPFRHDPASSVGEIRLTKPGNHTVLGGSDRWHRVIQHPFDLIVRGVLRYQLPFSSHPRSAKIEGRIKVTPDQDGDDLNSTAIAVGRRDYASRVHI